MIGMERMVRDEHSSGYKTALILKVLKSIALLQPFNLREELLVQIMRFKSTKHNNQRPVNKTD